MNKTILEAIKMDEFNNNLPELEVGEETTLREVWDGEGETPNGAYAYLISRAENGVETWINYQFDVLEEKENELDTVIKITDICLI